MLKCTVFGHRYRFTANGATIDWSCSRGCGAGGSKHYPTAADAKRYAAAFDHADGDDIVRRAPWLTVFPLRIWRYFRDRRR